MLVVLSVQGNYGHVFKGWMERDNQESQRKEVAIKKLTRQESERNGSLYEDFKNELEIMKVTFLLYLPLKCFDEKIQCFRYTEKAFI